MRTLVITGRDADPSGWLDTTEAAAALAAGRFDLDRREMTPDHLVESFGDWSPIVRSWAADLVATAEPSWPIRWEDPVQVAHGELAKAVFSGPLREELGKVDRTLRNQAIRAVSTNPDGMARATLEHCFQNQLSEEDVVALAPVILAAVESPSPADTMFNNVIRMAGLKALTKYHFEEGIAAAVGLAKTQAGHGSQTRTGEIMKLIEGYGAAAKPQIPALRELIASFNADVERREFPGGDLNNQRVGAVEHAIRTIETATTQPELRSITR